ncbi:hypothetical protein GJAV_G00112830 [Gymnothorax javanicus]|nr:hypothetical protein GJAV_G00112830 [Gymnothorax javanicus]
MDFHSGEPRINAARSFSFFTSLVITYLMLGTPTRVDGWTYHYSNKTMNWVKARKWCKTHYTDMVAIQNQEENVYLNDYLPRQAKYYWIGIRKITGRWTWVGTKKLLSPEASNWAENEPNNEKSNEDCVEIYVKRNVDTGKWNDESCRRNKTALCYKASCRQDSCSGNGECMEIINSHTCKCSPGFYGERCEKVVHCEDVKSPRRGFISCSNPFGNFSYGSECQFSCENGYELVGPGKIQCTDRGEWSAVLPQCQVAQCGELISPAHGSMHCTHPMGNFSYSTECEFHCEEGYRLTTSRKLQCGPDGRWTDSQPDCQASCQPDSCSGNGKCVEISGSLICNCFQGFSGERCESAVYCKEVNRPIQGFINCSHPLGNNAYRSECQFQCEEGYQLVGSRTIQCTASREWSAAPPHCEVVQCGELVSPANGSIHCIHPLGNFSYSAKCEFHCEEGYRLTTSRKLQCGPDGRWTDSQPHCQASCQPDSCSGNGKCEEISGSLICNCFQGFSGERCESAVYCKEVNRPIQGLINCSHPFGNYSYRSECHFQCEEGYQLVGSRTIQCTASREWSATPPHCEAIHCPIVQDPRDGSVTCTGTTAELLKGSTCSFSCRAGFTLHGSEVITCDASGNWVGEKPLCRGNINPQSKSDGIQTHPHPVLSSTSWDVITGGGAGLTALSVIAWVLKQLHQKKKFKQFDLKSCANTSLTNRVLAHATPSLENSPLA